MTGSLARATPPSLRICAGTRSSAITATAPASSAIRAWSALTTSMITPPRNISESPRFVVAVDFSIAVLLHHLSSNSFQSHLGPLVRGSANLPLDHRPGPPEPSGALGDSQRRFGAEQQPHPSPLGRVHAVERTWADQHPLELSFLEERVGIDGRRGRQPESDARFGPCPASPLRHVLPPTGFERLASLAVLCHHRPDMGGQIPPLQKLGERVLQQRRGPQVHRMLERGEMRP